MDFELLFQDSFLMPLTSTMVRVASLNHLIAIKQAAGRGKDLDDVARLLDLENSAATLGLADCNADHPLCSGARERRRWDPSVEK